MLVVALRAADLPQPALVIGLCPWTDIGARGASLFDNNPTDLVQGDMALQFGRWLVGGNSSDLDEGLRQLHSPITQNYFGLAPIYLQAGAYEVLVDMIRDFAMELQRQGCDVMLDVWPDMTHVFQAHGSTRPESLEAISRINAAIRAKTGVDGKPGFKQCLTTEIIAEIKQ